MAIKMWATNSWLGGPVPRAVFSVAIVLPLMLAGTLVTEEIRAAEEQETDPDPGGAQERPAQRGAQNDARNDDRSERRAQMRKKMLEKFDADSDGRLNDEERTRLREKMRERRGERGPRARTGRGDRGHGDRGHGNWGHGKREYGKRGRGDRDARDRGPDGPGGRGIFGNQSEGPRDGEEPRERGGRRGHRGPPDLDKLFQKFDTDGDDRLDQEEFKAALHALRKMHERGKAHHGSAKRGGRGPREGHDRFGPGPPHGPRPDREFRPGPPPERGPRARADRDEQ